MRKSNTFLLLLTKTVIFYSQLFRHLAQNCEQNTKNQIIMKLLLISNSTNAGEEYLRYPLPEIGRFLDGIREVVFVPYAAVTFSYAEYERKVQARFSSLAFGSAPSTGPRTPRR